MSHTIENMRKKCVDRICGGTYYYMMWWNNTTWIQCHNKNMCDIDISWTINNIDVGQTPHHEWG